MRHPRISSVLLSILVVLATLVPTSVAMAAQYRIDINVPTATDNAIIPPGKDIYVLGDLEGIKGIRDARLEVDLYNAQGDTVRRVFADTKDDRGGLDVDYPLLSYYGGEDRSPLRASMMPDIVYDGRNSATFGDVWRKAYFIDTHFAAVISGGVYDTDLRLQERDGTPIRALPLGSYKVAVSLYSDDELVVTATKDIKVGITSDVTCFRFSPGEHATKVKAFAAANGMKVLSDPLVGFWHPADNFAEFKDSDLFAEILPKWRWNDLSEYQQNHIYMFGYNVSETSATYQVEIGTAQQQGIIDDPSRFSEYYYDDGEPGLGNDEFVPFAPNQLVALTRIDLRPDGESNHVEPSRLNMSTSVGDVHQVVNVSGTDRFAINGVVTPVQNAPQNVRWNSNNTFDFADRVSAIRYTFTADGYRSQWTQAVGLIREVDGKKLPSVLEFEHEFAVANLPAGELTVTIEGLDSSGQVLPQTTQILRLHR